MKAAGIGLSNGKRLKYSGFGLLVSLLAVDPGLYPDGRSAERLSEVSGFGVRGGLGRRGHTCRLSQRGKPRRHGRLGAGQSSAHRLTWNKQGELFLAPFCSGSSAFSFTFLSPTTFPVWTTLRLVVIMAFPIFFPLSLFCTELPRTEQTRRHRHTHFCDSNIHMILSGEERPLPTGFRDPSHCSRYTFASFRSTVVIKNGPTGFKWTLGGVGKHPEDSEKRRRRVYVVI